MSAPDPGLQAVCLYPGGGDAAMDVLAVEAPLEIRVDGQVFAVLLRTPGEDLDLVAGFLAAEGILEDPRDLKGLAHCTDPSVAERDDVVLAWLAEGVPPPEEARRLLTTAACGLCGTTRLAQVLGGLPPLTTRRTLTPELIHGLAAALSAAQPRFRATGGLHGAALFAPDGTLLAVREDVGRHNAVDKVLGAQLRAGRWPLDGHLLAVSSRAGFEIVQKALVARLAAVVAVGAASSLAHGLAQEAGLALYSFVRPGRFNAHAPA